MKNYLKKLVRANFRFGRMCFPVFLASKSVLIKNERKQ